jgi:hypothetical protein
LIQLKSNRFPKVLVPLERLLDRSDVFVGTKTPCVGQHVVEVVAKSLPAVGDRFYWTTFTEFQQWSQLDFSGHRLLYQMGGSSSTRVYL